MRVLTPFFKPFGSIAQVFIAQAAILLIALSMGSTALAQPSPATDSERNINDWLMRMHAAAMQKRSYIGTMVQSSAEGMSSARIWHACDGAQQVERIETLTGAPRSILRHNDKVITFMPEQKVARVEMREAIGGFPDVLQPGVGNIPEFYAVKTLTAERVAGLDAEVVQLMPKDALRFGYRIWTDKKSNLVLKLQTLGPEGAVIEQAAFSELQLDAPVKADKLNQMMAATQGYRVEQTPLTKTTAAAQGWLIKAAVPGFKPMSCYQRGSIAAQPAGSTLQWIFSDGLATVSLFIEDFDKLRHTQEGFMVQGATHTLLKRLNAYWLTAVGEVPPQTLKLFAQQLERAK
jgi:sigma-E factor negative regulatory protein RseB